jgi:TonB family protein
MARQSKRREKITKAVRIAAPVVIVLAVGIAIWRFACDTAGEKREAPPVPTVLLTPPPPPPPPPPTPKQPEPQKTVETSVPSPTPKTESPKTDAPKQMTINGPAQAGSDSFGMKAGDGGGRMVGGDPNGGDGTGGGDFAEGAYRRLLASALQAAIQSDDQASRLIFSAEVRVWVAPDGRIDRVVVARSSGDPKTDRLVVAALMQAGRIDAPPAQLKFPALVALKGRRA